MKEFIVTEKTLPEMTYYVGARSPRHAIREAERIAGRPLCDAQVTEARYIEFDPDLVLGFVRLERSEVGPTDTCPQCGQDFGDAGVFLGFVAGPNWPEPFGPICAACATTE